ncbi:hypothetical protein U9M48_019514 [Paspalum notatum var. saurae]|uniref:Retrovirus-related Pol polyprotein from transposon TNT 1-94 n=1 Tax=Paspalum notatum var. saurae TaxID=547442 RepID=A0AAQ3TFI8_PASNO
MRPDIQFAVGVPEGVTPHRCLADLEVHQIYPGVWGLVLRGLFSFPPWLFRFGSCWVPHRPQVYFWYLSSSRKQSSVATSTCETEYVAAILWMLATLRDYGLTYGRIPILCNSSSAISVAKNPVLHSRTKHIDVRYHFLRDNYQKGMIDIVKVASENQVADILTKPLDLETFARLRGELGGW